MDVKKLATLSKLKIDKKEEGYFKKQFEETIKIIEEFNKLDTSKTSPTYIVTGTQNVLREDKIDSSKIFSQEDTLSNAKRTHNGFFVVDAILNEN
jgi:aspartyl/glutamyl-tRNA(Asn/Gln) amidotransferase C subunit